MFQDRKDARTEYAYIIQYMHKQHTRSITDDYLF